MLWMQSLSKSALLLASGVGMHIASSSPNPPWKKRAGSHMFEFWVHQIACSLRIIMWISVALDILATLAAALQQGGPLPGRLHATMCPSRSRTTNLPQPSLTFIAGSIILFLSGCLRRECYKALGPMFRFEVSIQPNHRLVTTGPYSFVRHPSYLSASTACLSGCMVLLARGAYIRECLLPRPLAVLQECAASLFTWSTSACAHKFMQTTWLEWGSMFLLALWTASVFTVHKNICRRLTWEEEVLRKEFKQEWIEYAKTVRWRVIPGIL